MKFLEIPTNEPSGHPKKAGLIVISKKWCNSGKVKACKSRFNLKGSRKSNKTPSSWKTKRICQSQGDSFSNLVSICLGNNASMPECFLTKPSNETNNELHSLFTYPEHVATI